MLSSTSKCNTRSSGVRCVKTRSTSGCLSSPDQTKPTCLLHFRQEAQLMLTTGSTRLAVSRGQQTRYHFRSIATFR